MAKYTYTMHKLVNSEYEPHQPPFKSLRALKEFVCNDMGYTNLYGTIEYNITRHGVFYFYPVNGNQWRYKLTQDPA